MIPTLETKRLILRAPKTEDFEAYAEFMAGDRSKGVGGPMDRAAAWGGFVGDAGQWVLLGYGFWIVEEKSSGKPAGQVGFWHPDHWPEVELGWTMFEGFEGLGYAHEAAQEARKFGYEVKGWGPIISLIVTGNARSVTLAEKLGATFERDWQSPAGHKAMLYRHPAPEALQ